MKKKLIVITSILIILFISFVVIDYLTNDPKKVHMEEQ